MRCLGLGRGFWVSAFPCRPSGGWRGRRRWLCLVARRLDWPLQNLNLASGPTRLLPFQPITGRGGDSKRSQRHSGGLSKRRKASLLWLKAFMADPLASLGWKGVSLGPLQIHPQGSFDHIHPKSGKAAPSRRGQKAFVGNSRLGAALCPWWPHMVHRLPQGPCQSLPGHWPGDPAAGVSLLPSIRIAWPARRALRWGARATFFSAKNEDCLTLGEIAKLTRRPPGDTTRKPGALGQLWRENAAILGGFGEAFQRLCG